MAYTKEVERSTQEISKILYPTGLNPKGPPNAEACKLLEELDKIEPQRLKTWIWDGTPQRMWLRSFRDLASMGPHINRHRNHHYQ